MTFPHPSAADIQTLADQIPQKAAIKALLEMGIESGDGRTRVPNPQPGAPPVPPGEPGPPPVPAGSGWADFKAEYEWIPKWFADMTKHAPEDLGPLVSEMKKTKDAFDNPSLTSGLNQAAVELHDWEGDGAVAFENNFLFPAPYILNGQKSLAESLHGALTAYQDTLAAVNIDLADVAQKTLDNLDLITEDGGGDGVSFALTVLSAVATVASATAAALAAAPTGGASLLVWSVGFAAVAGGSSVGASLTASGSEANASTVAEIIRTMAVAMGKVVDGKTKQEEKIVGTLTGNMTHLEQHRRYVSVPAPGDLSGDGSDTTNDSIDHHGDGFDGKFDPPAIFD